MTPERKLQSAQEFVSMVKAAKDDAQLLDIALTIVNKIEEIIKDAPDFIAGSNFMKEDARQMVLEFTDWYVKNHIVRSANSYRVWNGEDYTYMKDEQLFDQFLKEKEDGK